jgi:hypothetical protein
LKINPIDTGTVRIVIRVNAFKLKGPREFIQGKTERDVDPIIHLPTCHIEEPTFQCHTHRTQCPGYPLNRHHGT